MKNDIMHAPQTVQRARPRRVHIAFLAFQACVPLFSQLDGEKPARRAASQGLSQVSTYHLDDHLSTMQPFFAPQRAH